MQMRGRDPELHMKRVVSVRGITPNPSWSHILTFLVAIQAHLVLVSPDSHSQLVGEGHSTGQGWCA